MSIESNPFDHILYEFQMYIASYPTDTGDKVFNNMKVDSHLVHLRNLAYFFDKKKGKHTDLHASNYVIDADPFLIDSERLSDIYNCTSGAVCHMSKNRLNTDFKQKTIECELHSFRMFLLAIYHYLDALDESIKPEYIDLWNDENIKRMAKNLKCDVYGLMLTHCKSIISST